MMVTGKTTGALKIDDTPSSAYSLTARALHWITAALVLTTIPLGVVILNECRGPRCGYAYPGLALSAVRAREWCSDAHDHGLTAGGLVPMALRQCTRAAASFARESIMVDHHQYGRWRRSADFCPIIHAIVHSLSSALRSASISPRRQARVPESASGKPQCARAFLLLHQLLSCIDQALSPFF